MFGLLMSIVAGMAMSIQGVMNTRLSQRIGLYASNAFVQATAFVLSALTLLIMGGNLKALPSVPKV